MNLQLQSPGVFLLVASTILFGAVSTGSAIGRRDIITAFRMHQKQSNKLQPAKLTQPGRPGNETVICTDRILANIDYAGLGYDAMLGNPHGDLYDPGFREPVIQLEYLNHSTTSDGRWLIPDGVQVLQTVSCSYETDSSDVTGSTSYQNSLSEDAEVNVDVLGVKFTGSFSFKEVREGTSHYRRSYVSSVARCSSYKADINYRYAPFKVTAPFAAAVDALPTVRDDAAYLLFISVYGTHFASTLYMGAKSVMRSEFESTNWTRLTDDEFDIKAGASASFWIFTVGASSATEKQKKLAETFDSTRRRAKFTYLGTHPPADGKWQTWANSTDQSPYPIQYTLNPLSDLLNARFFPTMGEDGLATRRRLLNATMELYCRGVKGCGVPDADRPTVRMDRSASTFHDTVQVSCRPGFSLLSCGVDNFQATDNTEKPDCDYKRYAVPVGPTACECNDKVGAACVPWCTNDVTGFEIVRTSHKGGREPVHVKCPANKKVLGCHFQPDTDLEVWRRHYPSDDGTGCTCYDFYGGQCVATCASNITNHEVRSQFGYKTVKVECSPGNYVLGCGVNPILSWPVEKLRTYNVASQSSCQCYDEYGVTCYAVCGLFD